MITQDSLKKFLHYAPETGIFIRHKSVRGYPSGYLHNHINDQGYVIITVCGRSYRGHRLAWLYMYGYMPENQIDHIDRNRANNKITNLREVTQSCNNFNSGNHITNTSGIKGVSFLDKRRVWLAQIQINNINHFLGHHKNKIEAVCARLAAEQCLGITTCETNSPALMFIRESL